MKNENIGAINESLFTTDSMIRSSTMMFDDNIKKLKKRLLNAQILLFIMLYVNSCFVDLFWKIPSVVNKQVKYWNDYENGKENLSFMK